MVATFTLDDVQVTWVVRLCVVPSLKLPVAVNCWELPRAMLALLGVIVIEVRVPLVTVNDAVPTCPANSAVMVAAPGAIPVADPLVPAASLTLATDAGDEVHNTEFVRFWVLPSANVPIAPNCARVCCATVALAGVICTDVSGDDSTTRAAVPLTEPCCAVMVAVPADWPVTWPELLMLATLLAEELHVTALVMVWVLPSLNVPVAVYPCVDAGASTAAAGLTAIEVSVTELTFKGADPVTPLRVALIFAVPGATAVVRPPLPTVAAATLSDAQVTSRVMTCVLESLNDPVAVNDNLVAGAIV